MCAQLFIPEWDDGSPWFVGPYGPTTAFNSSPNAAAIHCTYEK